MPSDGPRAPAFPAVARGTLLAYRLFDVADVIDLDRAQTLLGGSGERLRLAGERTGFLELPDRPLTLDLGDRSLDLGESGSRAARVHVRLFAHGVASVRYDVPLPPGCGAEALAALTRSFSTSDAVTTAARAEAGKRRPKPPRRLPMPLQRGFGRAARPQREDRPAQ